MAENYRDDYFPINLQAGLYDLQRKYGGPTQYPEIQRPVTDDILESGWIYAGFILAFSLIVVLPGLRIVQVGGLALIDCKGGALCRFNNVIILFKSIY